MEESDSGGIVGESRPALAVAVGKVQFKIVADFHVDQFGAFHEDDDLIGPKSRIALEKELLDLVLIDTFVLEDGLQIGNDQLRVEIIDGIQIFVAGTKRARASNEKANSRRRVVIWVRLYRVSPIRLV